MLNAYTLGGLQNWMSWVVIIKTVNCWESVQAVNVSTKERKIDSFQNFCRSKGKMLEYFPPLLIFVMFQTKHREKSSQGVLFGSALSLVTTNQAQLTGRRDVEFPKIKSHSHFTVRLGSDNRVFRLAKNG
jgi:hypothetical protein